MQAVSREPPAPTPSRPVVAGAVTKSHTSNNSNMKNSQLAPSYLLTTTTTSSPDSRVQALSTNFMGGRATAIAPTRPAAQVRASVTPLELITSAARQPETTPSTICLDIASSPLSELSDNDSLLSQQSPQLRQEPHNTSYYDNSDEAMDLDDNTEYHSASDGDSLNEGGLEKVLKKKELGRVDKSSSDDEKVYKRNSAAGDDICHNENSRKPYGVKRRREDSTSDEDDGKDSLRAEADNEESSNYSSSSHEDKADIRLQNILPFGQQRSARKLEFKSATGFQSRAGTKTGPKTTGCHKKPRIQIGPAKATKEEDNVDEEVSISIP